MNNKQHSSASAFAPTHTLRTALHSRRERVQGFTAAVMRPVTATKRLYETPVPQHDTAARQKLLATSSYICIPGIYCSRKSLFHIFIVFMVIHRVCVYCASSDRCAPHYLDAAEQLGRLLARDGKTVVYGGGSTGLMGRLAEGALAERGNVIGIIPTFMQELEWGHLGLTELHEVADMHQRKLRMMKESEGIVALPGGVGTFEELLEAISWKRLGLVLSPIIIVNIGGFYDPLVELLERSVRERFLREEHLAMWTVVDTVDEVIAALHSAPPWSEDARTLA